MENAGISCGEHSVTGSAHKDKKRVDNARFKTSKKQKSVRWKLRQGKLKAEEERKAENGKSYSSGKFNDIDPLQYSSSDDDDIPLADVKSKISRKR